MSRYLTPLSLDHEHPYVEWREAKLARAPATLDDVVVEVKDPRRLSDAEHAAILACCRRANLAVYASAVGDEPDKAIPHRLGLRFGLKRLDHNPGADDDAITAVKIQRDALHRGYIPYTDRPIAWHTDGYYNQPDRRIGAFILHCVRPAVAGGSNGLADPDLLYIRLRDRDPNHIRALMHAAAMTIPPNVVAGRELRPVSTGPVFTSDQRGRLTMRYTDRRRNIQWRDDPATAAAVGALREVLNAPDMPRFELKLEPGWGLICNNVLHRRSAFSDPEGAAEADGGRLLFRARYYDRVDGT
jgi:hypothetical protein